MIQLKSRKEIELIARGGRIIADLFEEIGPRVKPGVTTGALDAFAEEFIQSVSKHYQLALLSNTNEVHWQQIVSSTPIFSSFAKTFLSFETGHHKPTVESYDQVISHFDCDPGAIFFLDDSPKNVRAAQQLRIDAHQVCGIEQARAIVANDLGNS